MDELPNRLVEDYEFYMKTERKCAHNTVMKNLKNFNSHDERVAKTRHFSRKTNPHGESQARFLEYHELIRMSEKHITVPGCSRFGIFSVSAA